MTAFMWLLALVLRSTVVLVVALSLGGLLRRSTALARHRLLTLTAMALLLLPALPRVLPRWELGIVPPWMETRSQQATGHPTDATSVATAVAEPVPVDPPGRGSGGQAEAATDRPSRAIASPQLAGPLGLSLGAATVSVWLMGMLAGLLGLGRALWRERRLLAAGRPLAGPWLDTLDEAQRAVALSRPVRLLACEEIQTPLTGGWRRPAVLLPPSAEGWPDERRRVVVQHELVHVVRGDGLRHLAWRLVAVIYWFHPLARLAEREASIVGEQACDETVLDLGTRPSAYARHLIEIAESLRARPLSFASALPMIDRSQLERRLVMILDPDRSAGRGRAVAGTCLTLLFVVVLGVGAAMPVPQSAKAAAPAAKAVGTVHPVPPGPGRSATSANPYAACTDGIVETFSSSFSFIQGMGGTDFDGVHGGDFALHQDIGDGRRLCAYVHGPVSFDERTGSIRELPRGSSVLVETRKGRERSQRMLVTTEQGEPRYQWWLDGNPQTVDDAAHAWLADALEVMARSRAIGSIHGQVGSLQGEIGSIQGEIGALQGQIGSIQGEQGSLQGKIGSIQGQQGSLQGAIGGHQGAIGSLEGTRWQASAAQRERIDREVAAHADAIRKLEAEMASLAFSRQTAKAETELRAFEESGERRIADLERQIKAIQAEDRIGRLEREIEDLHAEDRIRELERQLNAALERLKADLLRLGC